MTCDFLAISIDADGGTESDRERGLKEITPHQYQLFDSHISRLECGLLGEQNREVQEG